MERSMIRYFKSSGRVDWDSTIVRIPAGAEIHADSLSKLVRDGVSNGSRQHAARALTKFVGCRWGHTGRVAKTLVKVSSGFYKVVEIETTETQLK